MNIILVFFFKSHSTAGSGSIFESHEWMLRLKEHKQLAQSHMTMKKLSQGLDQVWFQIPDFLLLTVIVCRPKAVTTASKSTSLPSITLVHWSSHTNIRTGRFLAGSWGRRLCRSPDKDRGLGLGAEPILLWGDLAGLFWNQTHVGRGSDTIKVSSGQGSGVVNHDLASWVLCSFLAHFCYCLCQSHSLPS